VRTALPAFSAHLNSHCPESPRFLNPLFPLQIFDNTKVLLIDENSDNLLYAKRQNYFILPVVESSGFRVETLFKALGGSTVAVRNLSAPALPEDGDAVSPRPSAGALLAGPAPTETFSPFAGSGR